MGLSPQSAARFGAMRSLLHGAPSPGAWRQLCALVDEVPHEPLRDLIPYLADHLRRWPPHLLQPAPGWWHALSRRRKHLKHSLIRGLTFTRQRRHITPGRLSGALMRLRYLDAQGGVVSLEQQALLLASGVSRGLAFASLGGGPARAVVHGDALARALPDTLEALCLDGVNLTRGALAAALDHEARQALRVLALREVLTPLPHDPALYGGRDALYLHSAFDSGASYTGLCAALRAAPPRVLALHAPGEPVRGVRRLAIRLVHLEQLEDTGALDHIAHLQLTLSPAAAQAGRGEVQEIEAFAARRGLVVIRRRDHLTLQTPGAWPGPRAWWYASRGAP